MKKFAPLLIIGLWITLFSVAYHYHLTNLSIEEWKTLLKHTSVNIPILFVLVFCLRIILFIPSSVLIVVGSFLFSPIEGICLSLIGMFLTETFIYAISRTVFQNKVNQFIHKKYPSLYEKILNNRSRYLFGAVATPLAPADAACFAAASTKMPYFHYITVVLLGNIPIAILYTFYGNLLISSTWVTLALSILCILVTGILFVLRKNKKQEEVKKIISP
ncbi:TVP38/TMEM64 family protein [Bacillus sp. RG28]|uniref:TVP38/TMEM64 family membrane protein n=1 Tax=Gottfriedia endophytica TaxID=2820819 RepID=A0A940NRV3_9BACI|nr:VTT domain-containing protein [Gottfriedia endophytica]MBP0727139.1 TVP38/TMEM64 family protein [Gottfriedia endophytica]